MSKTGDFLATASETGTIIRIFGTEKLANGERNTAPYQEVRRGSTNANIHSLVFDNGNIPSFLACSSDRETIHIFVVEHKDHKDQKKNPTGNVISSIFGNNEAKAFATFQLPAKNLNAKCGFSEDGQTLVVITQTGNYYECEVPASGGSMKAKTHNELLSTKSSAN